LFGVLLIPGDAGSMRRAIAMMNLRLEATFKVLDKAEYLFKSVYVFQAQIPILKNLKVATSLH
jgi:hypothetical protein